MKYATTILCALAGLLAMPVMAADGPALYRQHCAECHGNDGTSHSFRGYLYFARNLARPGWQGTHSDDDILYAMEKGPGLMPSFAKTLSGEDRQALVKVVRSLGQVQPQ